MSWCIQIQLLRTNPNLVGKEFTHDAYNASGLFSGSDDSWNYAPWLRAAVVSARRLH